MWYSRRAALKGLWFGTLSWLGASRAGRIASAVNVPVSLILRSGQSGSDPTIAEVRLHDGVPTLFIDGQPFPGLAFDTYGPALDKFRLFSRAGVHIFDFVATPTAAGCPAPARTAWVAPDKYDFSQLDERAGMVLEADPKAYLLPKLYLQVPKWWSDQHPDALARMETAEGKIELYIDCVWRPNPSLHKPAPSWTSLAWRRDTIEGLKQLLSHVEASSYADRCIGYHLSSGTTDEWMAWGANAGDWVDYSPANTEAFRRWLRAKYGNVRRLQKAWNDPKATFERVVIPSRSTRAKTEFGILRDPAKEQPVIDFYFFNSEADADTICTFAAAVKQITKRQKIVGVYYGYLLQLGGEERLQNVGHLALGKLLACPDLDYVSSPTSYHFRELGGKGTSYFMSLAGSVRLHGKMWLDENDIHTSSSPLPLGFWGKPADVAGDMLQQNKELAHVFTNGAAMWWFDGARNRYDNPAVRRRISEFAENARQVLKLDRTPVDQVAMVVDEGSFCYMRVGDPLGASLTWEQIPALARIGAPSAHYLLSDLRQIADRRMFLFMTAFAPTAAERAAIDSLKRGGRVLVFFYAPGVYNDGHLDEAAMSQLTGIQLRMTRTPTALQATLKGGHQVTEGLAGQTVGVSETAFPVCYADDPHAVVLGTFADGRAAIVIKPRKGGTAVFSAVPLLPASMLRRLAKLAGVHQYIETEDVVWANHDMVAICVHQPGTRTISLRRTAPIVRDLYTGEEIARSVDRFEASFELDATRVFVLESAEAA